MVKLPVRFNPKNLIGEDSHFSVTLPLEQFKRLSEVLAPSKGEVQIELTVDRGLRGKVFVKGEFSSTYRLECQRCMTEFDYPVQADFLLTFVADEEAAEELDEKLDPVVLDSHGKIHVVDMLEDELIFQLPLAACHADESICLDRGYSGSINEIEEDFDAQEKRPNPFEALKNLTKSD